MMMRKFYLCCLGMLAMPILMLAQPAIHSSAHINALGTGLYESYMCLTIGTTLSTDPIYSSYLWSTGATTPSIQFVTSFPQTDTLTLTVTDMGGNVSMSTIYMYGAGQFNPPVSQYATGGQGCQGDSLLLIGGFVAGDSMIWSNGHVVLNQNNCDVPYPSNGCAEYYSANGNAYFTLVNPTSGCRYVSSPMPFAFYPHPSQPQLYQSGDTLISSVVAPRYVWRDGQGAVISGATARRYLPGTAGNYTVQADGSAFTVNCYSPISAPYAFVPGCYATYVSQPDTGAFSVVLLNGCMPLASNGGSYFWDFGDGSSSTLENPTHTYSGPGSYVVCVNVSAAGGCNQTFCDTVVVTSKVNAPFSIRVVRSLGVGLPHPDAPSPITLWPNPSNSGFQLDFSLHTPDYVTAELIDLRGRVVRGLPGMNLPAGVHHLPIHTQGLASGTYLLRLQRGEQVDVLKAIIAD